MRIKMRDMDVVMALSLVEMTIAQREFKREVAIPILIIRAGKFGYDNSMGKINLSSLPNFSP